jgi:hypothetical protein
MRLPLSYALGYTTVDALPAVWVSVVVLRGGERCTKGTNDEVWHVPDVVKVGCELSIPLQREGWMTPVQWLVARSQRRQSSCAAHCAGVDLLHLGHCGAHAPDPGAPAAGSYLASMHPGTLLWRQ